jgi:hypothetical protein
LNSHEEPKKGKTQGIKKTTRHPERGSVRVRSRTVYLSLPMMLRHADCFFIV